MSALDKIETYQRMMRIQKHRLDDELEIQAELLHKISECVVLAKSRAISAKDELDRLEGEIYSDAKEDNPKATVPELQGITLRDADRIKLWQKYQIARHDQEAWEGLHEAWKSRGFAIRSLVDLRLASYYTTESRGDEHEAGRKALAAARSTEAAKDDVRSTTRRRALTD